MNTPAPVLSRLLQVVPPFSGKGRGYLSSEHRPYIVYGLNSVTINGNFGLSRAPNGIVVSSPPPPGFLTLVEWGSMVPRLSRVPVVAFDPGSLKPFPADQSIEYPYFPVAPFVCDLAASFVDVPEFGDKFNVVLLDVALVPADAANIAAAGLKFPRR